MVLQRTCNIVIKSCVNFINNYYSNTLFDFLSFLGYPKSVYNFVAYTKCEYLSETSDFVYAINKLLQIWNGIK